VCVFVECGGDALVVEAAGHDDDRDAGVEHLGRHEMPEVMEPEGAQPGGAAVPEECLGDSVGFTR